MMMVRHVIPRGFARRSLVWLGRRVAVEVMLKVLYNRCGLLYPAGGADYEYYEYWEYWEYWVFILGRR